MNSDTEEQDENTPPRKKTKTTRRVQKFRKAWLTDEEFKTWLQSVPNPEKAKCKICNSIMKADRTVISNHSKSQSHKKNTCLFSQKS
ncbi:hypothetical protein ACS0PU_009071 [Formica fusca]